jgi:hypothetical protein
MERCVCVCDAPLSGPYSSRCGERALEPDYTLSERLVFSSLRSVRGMSISSTLVHGAEIRFREAADALRPYVGCFWVITAERGAIIRVVPDGTMAISIQLQKTRPAEWSLRGPLLRPDERRFKSPATLIGVRLRPGVAFILSAIPADSLVDRRIGLGKAASFRDLVRAEPRPHTPAQYIAARSVF